ncbi:hypothetical protein BQ8482_60203 [Mesorhizobium delmotii]|uniref:Uncharacterized protein n=1 Tax=Mesorhizobium delmotii TaxID=1631247 RepID=A0A2P9AVG7_9HYPH|nr:hypothetical protein BQ8482_60203 [Mesorhizobium delmotii]
MREFVVITNNYRADGGGNFPEINTSKIICKALDTNRDVIVLPHQPGHDQPVGGRPSLGPVNHLADIDVAGAEAGFAIVQIKFPELLEAVVETEWDDLFP